MDRYAIFTMLWQNLAIVVDNGGGPIIAGLMGKVGPWFKLCVPAYLVMILLIATWKSNDDAMLLFFRSLFLASIIYTLSSNAVTFDHYVIQIEHGIVHGLTTAVAGGFNKSPADHNAYDILGARAFSIGLGVFKNLPNWSWKAIPLGFLVVLYWFGALAAILVLFCVDLISYVLSDVLVDVAPIFIPLYFFPYTKTWFDGWLSCLMTMIVSQIFTVVLGSLFVYTMGAIFDLITTGLTGSALQTVDGGVAIGEMMMLIIAALVALIFVLISGAVVYVAVRITGGVHAELGKLSPGWSGNQSTTNQSHNNNSHSGSYGGDQAASGRSTSSDDPARQYAFQRTVGAAL